MGRCFSKAERHLSPDEQTLIRVGARFDYIGGRRGLTRPRQLLLGRRERQPVLLSSRDRARGWVALLGLSRVLSLGSSTRRRLDRAVGVRYASRETFTRRFARADLPTGPMGRAVASSDHAIFGVFAPPRGDRSSAGTPSDPE